MLSSDILDWPQEVLRLPLEQAFKNPRWRGYFPKEADWLGEPGSFVYVPEKLVLEKPLCLSCSGQQRFCYLIVMEQASQANFLQVSHGEGAVMQIDTHVVVKEQANLAYYSVQDCGLSTQHTANTTITLLANSAVSCYQFSLGSLSSQEKLTVALSKMGAASHLYGLYLPAVNQTIEHQVQLEHQVPKGFSKQVYKGIIGQKGRAAFNGRINVYDQAQQTCAYQNNQNLLLAEDAHVETKPELEIYADDVKCSHGATVGQIDQQALFYLRSRGINESLARALLIRAFAEEILSFTNHSQISDYVRERVTTKIDQLASRLNEKCQ